MRALLLALAMVTAAAGTAAPADTPWVMVGRKVVGRIEHMVQSPDSTKPQATRYDVAVVLLEAPAEKVYDTVIATVAEHPDYRYLTRNDVNRDVEVTNGSKSAGVHVVALGDKLSQLMIASVIEPGEASPVPFAVRNVLRICEKMHVTCTVSTQP
jgi:hypothetical protein